MSILNLLIWIKLSIYFLMNFPNFVRTVLVLFIQLLRHELKCKGFVDSSGKLCKLRKKRRKFLEWIGQGERGGGGIFNSLIKGTDVQCMVVELVCSIVDKFFGFIWDETFPGCIINLFKCKVDVQKSWTSKSVFKN